MEASIRSALDQEYPGEVEYLLAVPSRGDPAFKKLEALAAGAGNIRLVVSDAKPEKCSEKILNLLCGVRHASPASEVLLFADADLIFPSGWLLEMVRPLRESGVAVSTAHALPPPESLPGELLRLWTASGMIYMDSLGIISGNSMAITKKDFLELGVEQEWLRSISDDLALSRLVKKAGKTVRFVAGAVPSCRGPRDIRSIFSLSNKWTAYFKFYARIFWISGAALTGFKYYAFWWSLSRLAPLPFLVLLAGDLVNLALISFIFKSCANGGQATPRGGVLPGMARLLAYDLLLQAIYAANFATSFFRRQVDWGGYRYRIHSAGSIEAAPIP